VVSADVLCSGVIDCLIAGKQALNAIGMSPGESKAVTSCWEQRTHLTDFKRTCVTYTYKLDGVDSGSLPGSYVPGSYADCKCLTYVSILPC
jgi:hypothetical protein